MWFCGLKKHRGDGEILYDPGRFQIHMSLAVQASLNKLTCLSLLASFSTQPHVIVLSTLEEKPRSRSTGRMDESSRIHVNLHSHYATAPLGHLFTFRPLRSPARLKIPTIAMTMSHFILHMDVTSPHSDPSSWLPSHPSPLPRP